MLFVVSAIIHVKYVPYCKCNRRLVLDVKLIHIIYFLVYFVKEIHTKGVSMETGTHRVSFQRGQQSVATWRPVYQGTSLRENDSSVGLTW